MNPKLTLSALALAGLSSLQLTAGEKPNIIFIFADDLGYGDVKCLNPESKIPTPFFDKLATTSQVYTDAHANASVSTPSRYGIITGRHAWRSRLKKGVLKGFGAALIEKDRPTVASMLKDNGYNTAMVGKWHLGLNGWVSNDGKAIEKSGKNVDYDKTVLTQGPYDLGFDYFYGISASLDMSPFLLIENNKYIERPSHYYEQRVDKARNPYGGNRDGHAIKDRMPEFFLNNFTEKTVELIGKYSKQDKPFFIYFPLNAPHTPVAPHDDFKGKSGVDSYGDYVMEVDYRISQVYKALKDNGIADNTLVIISSDNGPEVMTYRRFNTTGHTSSGALRGAKRDLWEGGHRVPMFVSWPKKIKKGERIDNTVCLLDFYATVAELVGHKTREGECPDSHSYLYSILGERGVQREYTIHHSVRGNFAVRKGDWVLIEKGTGTDIGQNADNKKYYSAKNYVYDQKANGELYNLKQDLGEYNNLYTKHPEIVKELMVHLNECRNAKK